MASKESGPTIDLTLSETIDSLLDSYRRLNIPLERYLFVILVPSFLFFLVTVAVFALVDLPLMIAAPVPLLGALIFLTAVFFPKIQLSQQKQQLNNRYHIFVTHMTVLATTKINRMEVFRKLSREEEYGALATETRRVVELVDTWNQSLDDALRRRAKEVPSDTLTDFFERLAYTLGAGQALDDYLVSEQDMIIQDYITVYEGTLDSLDVMKDLYLSMILSMTFALVFAVVLPVLTGTDPTMTVGAVIVLFFFVQTGFYLAIRSMAPYDPVWYHPEEIYDTVSKRIRLSLLAGFIPTIVLLVVTIGGLLGVSPGLERVLPVDSVPIPLYVAIPITPLLIPGLYVRSHEKRIKGRDSAYPSFIRALGATEGAKQSTTTMVLRTLRKKDFGPLTDQVNDLYKRLNMRLKPEKAWRFFTADCRSYLIQKFSEMYLVGRAMGGSPKLLGELISENMNEVLQLRQQRHQATITLIGLLYGITAASTFAFFIGLQVVNILSDLSLGLASAGTQFDVGTLINTEVYNIPFIEYLLVMIILFNAMLSSLMIRTVDGGHKLNAYMHFVILTWLGSLTAILTKVVVTSVIGV
jgi:flagellar protein FlaJ